MLNIFLWGTGLIAQQVMNRCLTLSNYNILGFIDNDSGKIGKDFAGKMIFKPDILNEKFPDKIVIVSDSYAEIENQIIRDYPQYIDCIENKYFFYKESILKRYQYNDDPEIREVVNNIKENGLAVFNYPFVNKYLNYNVEVFWDQKRHHFFVIHNGHKMYFPRKYKIAESVARYYKSVLLEQDECSPHRYLTDDFNVHEGDIVIDVGVAEGNFALDIIDKVKKLYLIEADDDWIDALKMTFSDYIDKVTIIKGYVSSYNEYPFVRLDSLINESVDFIKMDIEGNEWDGLKGASELIRKSPNLKMAICAYHSDFDQELIESYMDKHGINHETSYGYMWFPYMSRQTYVSTSLNRALIRGRKDRKEL